MAKGGYNKAIIASCCANLFVMGKLVKKYDSATLRRNKIATIVLSTIEAVEMEGGPVLSTDFEEV